MLSMGTLALAPGCGVLGVGGRQRSARGGWERFEAAEGGDELAGPGPGALEVQLASAGGGSPPGGDGQQPVAQPLGLGLLKLAVEHQCLGPDDQIVGEQDYLEPYLVVGERPERELAQAGVLVVADAVFDVGALAVAALDERDALIGLVGEDGLEAVAVVVGE